MAVHQHSIREEWVVLELAKAVRLQRCVLLMGLGISLLPNDETYPQKHLKELLRRMIQWCVDKKLITQDGTIEDFQKMLKRGELEKVDRKLQEYLTEPDQKEKCLYDSFEQSKQQIQYIYQLLSQIDFRAYITTSYDNFLETAYIDAKRSPEIVKYFTKSIDDAVISYRVREPFILKLHGDVTKSNPETITFRNRFIRSYLPEAITYPKQVRDMLAHVHTLFFGFEKDDPDLAGLKSLVNKRDDCHRWVLVPEDHFTDDEVDLFWKEDKITILTYPNHVELVYFLRKLEEEAATPQPVEVYISYMPKDNKMRDALQLHLNLVNCRGLDITWNDGRIAAGEESRLAVEERLRNANVILLFISVDYLNSVNTGNIEIEMRRAIQRDRQGQARVIPIILRQCAWKDSVFARLAALPASGKPLAQATNKDSAYYEVAEAIKLAIEKWAEEH